MPTLVSSRSVARVSATNRPAGRIASISAGVRNSIIRFLSSRPFCPTSPVVRGAAVWECFVLPERPSQASARGVTSRHVGASRFLRLADPGRVPSPAVAARRLGRLQCRRMGVPLGAVPRDPRPCSSASCCSTLLVRARGTVRAERAVSWWDVLGFARLALLTSPSASSTRRGGRRVMVLTIIVGVGAVLARARGSCGARRSRPRSLLRTTDGIGYIPAAAPRPGPTETRRHRHHRERVRRRSDDRVLAGRGIHGRMDLCVLTRLCLRGARRPIRVDGLGHTSPFPPVPRSTCGGRREQ